MKEKHRAWYGEKVWSFHAIAKNTTLLKFPLLCHLDALQIWSFWLPCGGFIQFSSVQPLIHVQLFAPPWTAAHQASLSITNSWSLPKFMSIESVMPSNHFILCHPLLLPPSIFPSIRIFSNKSAVCIRWPKYWSFSFSISPSNEHPGLIFRMDCRISLHPRESQESSPILQFKSNNSLEASLHRYN